MALEEELVDDADGRGLFGVDNEVAILSSVIAEEIIKRDSDFLVSEAFPMPQVAFSEMERASFCASKLMIVIKNSPLASNVQMFSFSK